MPRPYVYWDPAWNAADVVAPGDGPLVVTDADHLARLVTVHAGLQVFADHAVGYHQRVIPETGQGLRVDHLQYLPSGLTFATADPVNGEPLPLDAADAVGAPWSFVPCWLHLGWRLQVRGVLGSRPATGGQAGIEVTWIDGSTRAAGDARGGYTGALLRTVVQVPDLPPALHHGWGLLHGKRPQDGTWAYHPVRTDLGGVTAASLVTHNPTTGDLIRLEYAGGTPCGVALHRWDGAAWVTLHTDAADLAAYIAPTGDWPLRVQVVADLIAGTALPQPGSPGTWPQSLTRFTRLSLDQFEPYVPDRARWSERDWANHWDWHTTVVPYYIERQRPVLDLTHQDPALPGGPAALRAGDNAMGIGVLFGPTTTLRAWAAWDQAGYITTPYVSPVPTDEIAYGYTAPWCLVARLRCDMATWSTTLPVDILLAGTLWSGTPSTDNGIGLHWIYTGPDSGQGNLVVTYWDDDASAWSTITTPFDASRWDGVPVSLAVAWSGVRGELAGRRNYEIRLVVNGRTKASAIVPGLRLRGCSVISVGSDRAVVDGSRQSFVGLFRAGLAFVDAVSDDDLRRCWDDADALENASFEDADVRPGESLAWTWASHQSMGGWAGWNEARDALTAWQTDQEVFSAGWWAPHAWEYADATARLAATGFTPADVGGVAWQRSDDTLWQLTVDSPTAWAAISLNSNEAWAAALIDAIYYVFNHDAGAYAGRWERFSLWDFGAGASPPWLDAWTSIPPWDDTLGPGAGPTGWTGWYAALHGAGLHPCTAETFGEAWDNDPLSTAAGPLWVGGSTRNGRRYGAAITFPLTVPPDQHLLWCWLDDGRIVRLAITPGTYATATALASVLAAQWTAAVGAGSHTTWGAWMAADGTTGIWWGWEGVGYTSLGAALLRRDADPDDDARALIGLMGERHGRVRLRADEFTVPGVVAAGETFGMDGASLLLFDVTTDPYCVHYLALDNGGLPATFGAFDGAPDPTIGERVTLPGWAGAGATWDPGFPLTDPNPDLTPALFDAGTMEEDGFFAAEWPDELLAWP